MLSPLARAPPPTPHPPTHTHTHTHPDDLEMAEEKCTKAEDDLKEMVAELGEI